MKYAKVLRDFKIYETAEGTSSALREKFSGIKGELFTKNEVERYGVPPKAIEWVHVKKTDTYWFFGSRFDLNDKENPVKIEDKYWEA